METHSQPTRRCPHCGRELKPMVLPAMFGAKEPHVIGFEPCHCPEAERERIERMSEENERRAREEAEKRREAYRRAGIRPRFLDAESPMAGGIMAGVREGRGAYVFGPVGTGKTYLASAVARMAVDDGMRVRVTDMPGIIARLKGTFGTQESEEDVLSGLSRCGLLVIDDLGKEPPTDWTLTQVFRVVNDRYETMRPVVVTSQYDLKALGGRLSRNGDVDTALAIVSRLSEMCAKHEMRGADRRLHGQG